MYTTFIHCFTGDLDNEMKEKEVTHTISIKTQNMRESTCKPVKLVRMISQVGTYLQNNRKTLKYHEPVTNQLGNVIKKKQFHNRRRTQK